MIVDPSGERGRLEREVRVQKRLRELLLLFSRGVSSSLGLNAALESITPEIREILGAETVEIWLHERRERRLVLVASSGKTDADPVSIDDTEHHAVEGLRLERPTLRAQRLIAPLRGWRRALGTLVITRSKKPPKPAPLDDILGQRRLLEDTFNSLVDLVAVMDKDLRIVQTNEAFAARVGLKRTDVMRRPLNELVGPETLAYVEAADTWQGIVPAVQRRVDDEELDGTFLLTATPLRTQDGQTKGRVLVARDITRQTRLEAERAVLRERLTQSEKLASLGQFVAGIAHEMNNPLQGVLGHLELLIDMTEAAKPVKRELKQIYQEADRAAKIVRNLLVFAGSHRVARQRVPVERILTRAIASRRAALKAADIRIVRKQGEKLPPVYCDPAHLQQAFLNILINAEHAVAEGGQERRVEVTTAAREARHVTITFRDTGPGIPADVMPRIFDPFFTTKEVGRGTGLGLAITYGIIQEHGGTITVTNAPDGGAVFQIDLPAATVGDKVGAGSTSHNDG